MDVFDLVAKITLDKSDYDKGLNEAEKDGSSFGSKLKSGIGKGFAAVGAAATAATAAAATGIAVLTTQSVSAYAEYEQLSGGVQKLYGNMGKSLEEYAAESGKSIEDVKGEWQNLEDAQNLVLENAKQAYKTAGMDMNTYLDTATSFSASLINSLAGDTKAAAEQTDVAMRAISDNFNTFGGDLEGIKNAFQGFAKENYTMLDNLKLGYGGTKEEMERLIADANEWGAANGKAADLSIESFSDVITAIEQIQEKQNIAGTTLRESTQTIAGSLGTLKSAWENLVLGFADPNANLEGLIDNVIEAVVGGVDEAGNHINGFLDNIIPTIERAMGGIGQAIEKVVPIIAEELPKLTTQILPSLLNAGATLITGLAAELPALLQVLVDLAPTIIDMTINSIMGALPQILSAGMQLISALATALINAAPQLLSTAFQLIQMLGQGIIDNLPVITEKAISLIHSLADGIKKNMPQILETGMNMIMELSEVLRESSGDLISAGIDLLMALVQGLIDGLPTFIETIPTIISNIAGIINDNAPKLIAAGIQIILALVQGIIKAIPTLIKEFPKIIKAIWDVITAVQWLTLGKTIIEGILNGVVKVASKIPEALKRMGETAVRVFKSIDWKNLGRTVLEFILHAVITVGQRIPAAFKSIGAKAVSAFKAIDWKSLGANIILGIIHGITNFAGKLKDAVTDAAKKAFNAAKEFLGIASPSKKFMYIGEMVGEGMAVGIDSTAGDVENAINDLTGTYSNPSAYSVSNGASVLSSMDSTNAAGNMTVILELDRMQFAKAVYKYNNAEVQRVGVNLAGGIA